VEVVLHDDSMGQLHFETPVGEKVRKIFGFCYVLKLAAEQTYRTSRPIAKL
jgi:hypothetical protein